ncbi:hypothetical protein N9821_00540 [Akkermansiaceae bacterium]|nr:hypothetical protein [Akkermansiaceae bacterium]MDB4299974.1 hypothetical protein [bacterium]MDB4265620.1 hypothetical protein [Akkermansiaceae bacterium]MDB4417034.1 hypothetical protein [Akkermansiaceae bacterium]MDB4505094.1 hypothetical protein [Akkermansiaceae bacterium]
MLSKMHEPDNIYRWEEWGGIPPLFPDAIGLPPPEAITLWSVRLHSYVPSTLPFIFPTKNHKTNDPYRTNHKSSKPKRLPVSATTEHALHPHEEEQGNQNYESEETYE